MKKVYLSILALVVTTAASAQVNNSIVSLSKSRNDNFSVTKKALNFYDKAQGEVLWTNDFSTPADWTIANEGSSGTPPHTQGDWVIVSTLPANLTTASGFSAFNSTSGGNFALIDSDNLPNQTQNSTIRTSANITLADLLTVNGNAANQAVYIKFNELYRKFREQYFVEVSNDGGATWTQIEVNSDAEVAANTNSTNPQVKLVNLTSVLGGTQNWSNNVKIGFRYQGAWDFFWAVDDVQLVVGFDHDAKLVTSSQSTDFTTTEGLDYYRIPSSQVSFPGLTFGADISNNGGASLAAVSLNVSGGTYNESSASATLAPGASDSLTISTPFMVPSALGSTTLTLSAMTGAQNDTIPGNNTATMTIHRDALVYGRDNDIIVGGMSQVTSQNAAELYIGNIMEVFDDMTVESVQIRLLNQAEAVNQEIDARIEIYNPTTETFDYLATTEIHTIATSDLNTFVTIPIENGPITISAGSTILVLAHHSGGQDEVAFGLAQNTIFRSVTGYTADGNPFDLLSPKAVMIRLKEAAPASISENDLASKVAIFPNPVVNGATIEVKGINASNISVLDLTGKVVYSTTVSEGTSKVSFDTTNFSAGVYTVNVATEAGIVSKKMVVKN